MLGKFSQFFLSNRHLIMKFRNDFDVESSTLYFIENVNVMWIFSLMCKLLLKFVTTCVWWIETKLVAYWTCKAIKPKNYVNLFFTFRFFCVTNNIIATILICHLTSKDQTIVKRNHSSFKENHSRHFSYINCTSTETLWMQLTGVSSKNRIYFGMVFIAPWCRTLLADICDGVISVDRS